MKLFFLILAYGHNTRNLQYASNYCFMGIDKEIALAAAFVAILFAIPADAIIILSHLGYL